MLIRPIYFLLSISARPLLLCCGLLVCFLHSLSAEYALLKGANGRILEFQVESVEVQGIRAVPRDGYKTVLLKWEQLDLDWLRQQHGDIWHKKEQMDSMGLIAYGDYHFGDSKTRIYDLVNSQNGYRLPAATFRERAPGALWVTFDPVNLRKFIRFHFDSNDQLDEIQIHRNFSDFEEIGDAMKEEWKRLGQMVASYQLNLIESQAFPSQRRWDSATKNANLKKGIIHVTHRWQDDERYFELALKAKEIGYGQQRSGDEKVTLFGKELNIKKNAEENTNWVVLVAKQRIN